MVYFCGGFRWQLPCFARAIRSLDLPRLVALCLGPFQHLDWFEYESVLLRVVSSIDLGYLRGVQAGLTEWGSVEDEVAFAVL